MTSENTPTSSRAAEAAAAQFANELELADEIRAQALTGLQRIREARASHAAREAKRLEHERDKNDPEIPQLQSRAANDASFSHALVSEIKRVSAGPHQDEPAAAHAPPPAAAATKPAAPKRKLSG